jgi:hypothetical protein
MRKQTISLLFTFGITAISLASFAPGARAGEGGAAGSAAFSLDRNGNVTGVAVSAGVGKEGAAAAAFNYGVGSSVANSAFAVGAAGTLNLDMIGNPDNVSISSMEDTDRAQAQANSLSQGFSVQLGNGGGDPVVTSPAAAPIQ